MTTENKNENTTPRDDQLFCTDCGRAIDAADAVIIGGEIFCSDCAPGWTECHDCGRLLRKDHDGPAFPAAREIAGVYFCDDCADDWTICTTCGALVSRDDATETASGIYCPDCCVECYDCGAQSNCFLGASAEEASDKAVKAWNRRV